MLLFVVLTPAEVSLLVWSARPTKITVDSMGVELSDEECDAMTRLCLLDLVEALGDTARRLTARRTSARRGPPRLFTGSRPAGCSYWLRSRLVGIPLVLEPSPAIVAKRALPLLSAFALWRGGSTERALHRGMHVGRGGLDEGALAGARDPTTVLDVVARDADLDEIGVLVH